MSALPTPKAHWYNHAADLPPIVLEALERNEGPANIVLPFALKAKHFPRVGGNDQLWVTLEDDNSGEVEFVLSCTKGTLGNYPIFIYTTKPSAQLDQEVDVLDTYMLQLVHCLLNEAMVLLEGFAKVFEEQTRQEHGIQAHEDLYYDATYSFCTSETLINKSSDVFSPFPESEDVSIALRPADESHLAGVAKICKAFAATSPPYLLDDKDAEMEAKELIDKELAWVHMAKKGDADWEIACLIAATRTSKDVTAVTKVYTTEQWRSRGCAGRLLHRVCQDVLQNKERVVLYVGNGEDLTAARRVYHKVGFQGLDSEQAMKVEGVERWIEIGFKGTDLGHW
ncbi:hypothetical protein JVU11DRAFT_4858 [Chiua virens]|nr:hypothetical protein JVU11DRAFT_4858 [Chiua virens]